MVLEDVMYSTTTQRTPVRLHVRHLYGSSILYQFNHNTTVVHSILNSEHIGHLHQHAIGVNNVTLMV